MQTFSRNFIFFLSALLLFTQPGCSAYNSVKSMFGGGEETVVEESPDSMAAEALDKFNHGKYTTSLKLFGNIQERFPFSRYSLMAKLKSADCHYYLKQYTEAIAVYEEFAGTHPTNEAIPYVLFQIGMCYYDQIDTIDRDPGSALNSESSFSKLVRLYQQSPYTPEARARILAARDFLANHEMYVATFYIKTNKTEQSISRLEYLLDNYPDTTVAPEAEELLALLNAGTPPKSTWRDWIPEIGLPDWSIFEGFGGMSP